MKIPKLCFHGELPCNSIIRSYNILMGHGHENMSSPNTYRYVFRSDDDDLINELVKIFSTVHP